MKKNNLFLAAMFILTTIDSQARVYLEDIQCIQNVGEVRCSSVTQSPYTTAAASCAQNIIVMMNNDKKLTLKYTGRGFAEATIGEKGAAGLTFAILLPLVVARVKASATKNAEANLASQTEEVLFLDMCNAQN